MAGVQNALVRHLLGSCCVHSPGAWRRPAYCGDLPTSALTVVIRNISRNSISRSLAGDMPVKVLFLSSTQFRCMGFSNRDGSRAFTLQKPVIGPRALWGSGWIYIVRPPAPDPGRFACKLSLQCLANRLPTDCMGFRIFNPCVDLWRSANGGWQHPAVASNSRPETTNTRPLLDIGAVSRPPCHQSRCCWSGNQQGLHTYIGFLFRPSEFGIRESRRFDLEKRFQAPQKPQYHILGRRPSSE